MAGIVAYNMHLSYLKRAHYQVLRTTSSEHFFAAQGSGWGAQLGSIINHGNMVLISDCGGLMGQLLGTCNNCIR